MDLFINKLVDASVIKKNWLGKVTDNYWSYLENATLLVEQDFNAHLFVDLISYFYETDLKFKEVLSAYSEKLSTNRGSTVFIYGMDDKITLLSEINRESFVFDFEQFCKELNGAYYNYEFEEISKTITDFKNALNEIDENWGLILNVG